jgi:hypothetical protein
VSVERERAAFNACAAGVQGALMLTRELRHARWLLVVWHGAPGGTPHTASNAPPHEHAPMLRRLADNMDGNVVDVDQVSVRVEVDE